MRRAAFEGRDACDRQRFGAEREVVHEPDKVDEITSSGVLDVPRERQGVELLGEVLVDGIDREPRPPEAEPLEDRVGEVGLEVLDDDIGGADINLEADELRAREACDDEEPQTTAGRGVEG
jgi:hypothetical protein